MAGDVKLPGLTGPPRRQRLADILDTVHRQSAIALPTIPRGPGDVVRPGVQRHVTHIGLDELHGYPDPDLADALKYGMAARQQQWAPPAPPGPEQFSDAEMVMDMIRRGFAVMKLPADGGPPKVLRDAVD